MAQRRMFSKNVARTDVFLDLPQTAQNLYFHLGIDADDDGFVSPKMVMRMLGSSADDLKLLIAKSFLLPFDDGVIVIRHWRVNNEIRQDRYKATQYSRHKEMLSIKDGVYDLVVPVVVPTGDKMDTQVRLGKDSIGKSINTHKGEIEAAKITPSTDNRDPDIQELWDFGKTLGFASVKEKFNRYAIKRLLKQNDKEWLKQAISYSQKIRGDRYAPQVNNWMDFEEKLLKLRDYAGRQKAKVQDLSSKTLIL